MGPESRRAKKIPPRGKKNKGLGFRDGDPLSSEIAERRARKRIGAPSNAERIPEVLPFEATLAYVFRSSGGKTTAINAARLLVHQDERFKRLVYAYDTASETDKAALRIEDLCDAAEITPDEFLAFVIPALWKRNVDIGRAIAAISHPTIVQKTIENAMTPGGFADRKILHEHTGFIPTKQGPVINIDNSRKTLMTGGVVRNPEVQDGPGLPAFSETMLNLSESLQKQLPAPDIQEAEIVQPDEDPAENRDSLKGDDPEESL